MTDIACNALVLKARGAAPVEQPRIQQPSEAAVMGESKRTVRFWVGLLSLKRRLKVGRSWLIRASSFRSLQGFEQGCFCYAVLPIFVGP